MNAPSAASASTPPSQPDGATSASRALAWAHTARFEITAAHLHQLPVADLPEIAFVGRSNAGKSTTINTLAQHRRLAFASKTPGRTQHINLFALGPREAPDARFADLPGYGYAAVERAAKLRWQQVMADYLQARASLVGIVLLVDARLGLTPLDRQLLAFVAPRLQDGSVGLLVALTKADKLNRRDRALASQAAQEALQAVATEAADIGVLVFSALKREGLDDLALSLRAWVEARASGPFALAQSDFDSAAPT